MVDVELVKSPSRPARAPGHRDAQLLERQEPPGGVEIRKVGGLECGLELAQRHGPIPIRVHRSVDEARLLLRQRPTQLLKGRQELIPLKHLIAIMVQLPELLYREVVQTPCSRRCCFQRGRQALLKLLHRDGRVAARKLSGRSLQCQLQVRCVREEQSRSQHRDEFGLGEFIVMVGVEAREGVFKLVLGQSGAQGLHASAELCQAQLAVAILVTCRHDVLPRLERLVQPLLEVLHLQGRSVVVVR
mmetsp:Transcript_65252/g.187924  ORF Transcript_65252/g.187924 Transcript_65252/m.187924 type:complete len:245 (+) Transcript_65252:672-1406(+)